MEENDRNEEESLYVGSPRIRFKTLKKKGTLKKKQLTDEDKQRRAEEIESKHRIKLFLGDGNDLNESLDSLTTIPYPEDETIKRKDSFEESKSKTKNRSAKRLHAKLKRPDPYGTLASFKSYEKKNKTSRKKTLKAKPRRQRTLVAMQMTEEEEERETDVDHYEEITNRQFFVSPPHSVEKNSKTETELEDSPKKELDLGTEFDKTLERKHESLTISKDI